MTYRGGLAKATLLERSRALRRAGTDAETLLWRSLRRRQMAGVKLRRQHQYGGYILDFFCSERSLVIEVDGGQHAVSEQAEYDVARTQYLEASGLRVIRFTNTEVLNETESVLSIIWDAVTSLPSP